ncbi:MAG: UDP-galactopyranose mutase, partial [uncultured Corynebacteriales bacterium]
DPGPDRRRLRLLRADRRRAGRGRAGPPGAGAGAARAPGRQRVLGAGADHRHRGAPLRRAPLPHLERARLAVRQPVHRVHRLPAPRLLGGEGPRLPDADQPRHDLRVLRAAPEPGAGPRARRRAGRRDHRPAGEPGGEGRLADRPAAVRGVRPRLHREAVADRPDGAAAGGDLPAAGPLHLRQPLLRRHVRGPAGRRLHRLAGADGRPPADRRPARGGLLRRPRLAAGRGADRLHRTAGPLLRQRRGRAGLADPGLRAGGAPGRRLPGHPGDELRRRRRAVDPHPRVPALPPGAGLPDRPHGGRPGVLPDGRPRRRAVLPGQHPGRPGGAGPLPGAGRAGAGGAVRRPARDVPVPGHAHGDRVRAAHGGQRPGPAAAM